MPPRRSRGWTVFAWVWATCLLVGTLVGVPGRSTHHALWAPARVLLVPAGTGMLVQALALRERGRWVVMLMAALALALIGVGAHEALPGPWTLLALPACGIGAGLSLWGAVGHRGNPVLERYLATGRRPVRARLMLGFTVLLCVTGLVLAVQAA